MLSSIFFLILLAVLGIAGIPLMMGIVPENPYYGWPTRRSSSRPGLWKQVNIFFGRAVVSAAVLAAILIWAYNGTWFRSGWAQLIVVLVAAGAAAGATFWYNQKQGG